MRNSLKLTPEYAQLTSLAFSNCVIYPANKIMDKLQEEIVELLDEMIILEGDTQLIRQDLTKLRLEYYDTVFQAKMIEYYIKDTLLPIDDYYFFSSEVIDVLLNVESLYYAMLEKAGKEYYSFQRETLSLGNLKYEFRFKIRAKLLEDNFYSEEEAWVIVKDIWNRGVHEFCGEKKYLEHIKGKGIDQIVSNYI